MNSFLEFYFVCGAFMFGLFITILRVWGDTKESTMSEFDWPYSFPSLAALILVIIVVLWPVFLCEMIKGGD